jgi:hypothetical protein
VQIAVAPDAFRYVPYPRRPGKPHVLRGVGCWIACTGDGVAFGAALSPAAAVREAEANALHIRTKRSPYLTFA